jgi:hypothetical protein
MLPERVEDEWPIPGAPYATSAIMRQSLFTIHVSP